MRWSRFAAFIIIATVLQASFVDVFAVTSLNIKPDLLLILLVFFAVYCSGSDAVIASFAIGFASDIIGPAMGPRMISFGLIGTLLSYTSHFVTIRRIPYQSVAIFISGLLIGSSAYFLALLKSCPSAPSTALLVLGISAYSAVAGPFLFLPSGWFMSIDLKQPRRL